MSHEGNDIVAGRKAATENETLARQIDEVLSTGFRWLRFPSLIEQRFIEDCDRSRRRHHSAMLIVALIMYDSFLIGDRQMIPDIFRLSVMVRLGLFTPLGIMALIGVRFGQSHHLRELLITLSCAVTGCSLVYFMINTHSPFASHYYMGIPLAIIFLNTVQRVRFWYAVAGSALILFFSAYGLTLVSFVQPQVRQTFDLVLFATCLFTLIALYRLEAEERTTYLFRLRDQLSHARERRLLDDLSSANRQLEHLTRSDPLTGIANRRHFQDHLGEVWKEAMQRRQPLSLLMLDVDFFKLYNDRYGHPAGDQCLRRTASAIAAALRKPADVVARYGGEEFGAILPNTSPEQAWAIAERVRQSVLALDLLHEASPAARIVTVSIGIATADTTQHGESVEKLIKAADKALYRAKQNGRNQVWPARDQLRPLNVVPEKTGSRLSPE